MHLVFSLVTAMTAPGCKSKANEDAYGCWPADAPRAAWVLDGVTGVNNRALLPGPSDAAWFVAQTQELLPALLASNPDMPATELVVSLARHLGARQNASWIDARGADGCEIPAASFGLARLIGDEIEIVNLGDCLMLLEAADGTVSVETNPVLDAIAAETKVAVEKPRAAGMTDEREIRPHLIPMILAQRRRRNRPGGYGILAADEACATMMQVTRIPASGLRSILLASDGYYRLVDHYGAATDAELVRRTRAEGAPALLAELRAIEEADVTGDLYPRIKRADDATALLVDIAAL